MSVVGLYRAPAAGAPMEALAAADVAVGRGVAGDRYRSRTGHWSDPRWPDQEVTFLEAETAEALAVDGGLLRRNVVTLGDGLLSLLGRKVQVGEAVFDFVRPCDPCRYLEELLGRPGLRAALEGQGGVRAAVVRGGTVRLGDPLEGL